MSLGTRIFEQFRIDELLVSDDTIAIYKGTDLNNNNRAVTVKHLLNNNDSQLAAIHLQFFRREMALHKLLQSNPISSEIYDCDAHRGLIVTESITGITLSKWMRENQPPFPIPLVIEWAGNLCDMLTLCHSQERPFILGRLDPDEIVILEDGKTLKILCYQLSRFIDKVTKERLTGRKIQTTKTYTPPCPYVPPPQTRNDLYTLAAFIYYLITGNEPGDHTAHNIEQQLNSPAPPWPKEYDWLFELIKINLSENVYLRHITAAQFKMDLSAGRIIQNIHCEKCGTVNPVRQPYCVQCDHCLMNDILTECNVCTCKMCIGTNYCGLCGQKAKDNRAPIIIQHQCEQYIRLKFRYCGMCGKQLHH